MKRKNLDSLDKDLIRILSEEGSIPMSNLATRLGVTAPTIRSRSKILIESGMLKIAGLIDVDKRHELTVALVGLNIQSYGQLDDVIEKLASLDQVRWAAVVTGRFDVFAEVVVSGGMAELHHLLNHIIPKMSRVVQSETFVFMKSRCKWICLPKGLKDW